MLELKKGIDILAAVGGVSTVEEAKDVFAEKLDGPNRDKLSKIGNEEALIKIANAVGAALFIPILLFLSRIPLSFLEKKDQ